MMTSMDLFGSKKTLISARKYIWIGIEPSRNEGYLHKVVRQTRNQQKAVEET